MKQAIYLALLAASAFSPPMLADDIDLSRLQGLGEIRYHRLESSVVERPYHLFVRLPEDYEENKDATYPTVYLLDGGTTFPMLAAYYRYLSLGDEVSATILVGISYGTDDWTGGNFRSTDFTAPSKEREYWGGAAKLQRVFENEIFPLVEKSYRSRADRRIVFGQSLGGQFVLFTALSRPGLFWGHIASNPALHRNLDLFLNWKQDPETKTGASALFVSSGSKDDERFRKPALQWMDHWEGQKSRPWKLRTVTLEGHSHFSAAPEAFRQGMIWLQGLDASAEGEKGTAAAE